MDVDYASIRHSSVRTMSIHNSRFVASNQIQIQIQIQIQNSLLLHQYIHVPEGIFS